MGRLTDKNAIITGAAGGIGLETSILFAKEGANVLMSDINGDQLARAVARVKELVPEATAEPFVRLVPPQIGSKGGGNVDGRGMSS